MRHRHSINCVVPPYIIRAIVENGTEEQKIWAANTSASDQTFRAFRSTVARSSTREDRVRAVLAAAPTRQRLIFDAGGSETLPGQLVRGEGSGPVGDDATDEAYDGLGATFDYYHDVHQRNSIDGAGMSLRATVHYGSNYQNAFWNGRQMVFGDGDGELFLRFTKSLDVIGHELAHGVTEHETGLVYMFQPGALNEHLSDVFGSLIKQKALGQDAGQADWLIGAELLGPSVNGIALRSMRDPGTAFDDPVLGKDQQPGHMNDYVTTWQDNGGVHINSGIPNRAFYLAASAIGGYAWEKAGRIWYAAMVDQRVREDTEFAQFARITIDAAAQLPGSVAGDLAAVEDAWEAVGVVPA
jgi:Zn-dependent metalloprotease